MTGASAPARPYKSVVKLTFFKGASLKDPARLFNSSLDGNVRRAIDIHEGEAIGHEGVQGAHSRSRRAQYGRRKEAEEAAEARVGDSLANDGPRPVLTISTALLD